MTDLPKEAVEAVAKRLAEYLEMGRDGNNLPPFIVEASATALLDLIAPMLVADAVAQESEACAVICDLYKDARAAYSTVAEVIEYDAAIEIAATIRTRGAK